MDSKHSTNNKEYTDLDTSNMNIIVLVKQNVLLQKEIERLHQELDSITSGIHIKGYLYKWRDREITFASKWGLRYFVLQGKSRVLSYFS